MQLQSAILLIVFSSYILASGQEKPGSGAPCPGQHDENLTYLYASDLLQKLEPPGTS